MRMSGIGLLGLAVVAAAPGALAQDAGSSGTTQTCVDVRIGNDRSAYLNCLNANLKHMAEREQKAPLPSVPYSASSPGNQIGVASVNSGHEQMGNAFGVSPIPQRPTPVFVNPVLGR